MDIQLKDANAKDSNTIASVLISSRNRFLPYAPSPHSNHEIEQWVESILIPSNTVVVALTASNIIGVLATSQDDNFSWIDQLYVAPDHVNIGVGSLLLNHALNRLPRPVRLYTFQQNTSARRFYKRFSFQAIEFTDGLENEERCPDVLYELIE